jgi:hypothetical protein
MLYVSFSIVGVFLGVTQQPTALEVTVGDIPTGGTAEVRFLLTSTLAVRRSTHCSTLSCHWSHRWSLNVDVPPLG